jgi:hypothetical protein
LDPHEWRTVARVHSSTSARRPPAGDGGRIDRVDDQLEGPERCRVRRVWREHADGDTIGVVEDGPVDVVALVAFEGATCCEQRRRVTVGDAHIDAEAERDPLGHRSRLQHGDAVALDEHADRHRLEERFAQRAQVIHDRVEDRGEGSR